MSHLQAGENRPRNPLLRGHHVLVTGGCGFIGSHLCGHLLDSGARVRVLDDLSTGSRANLEHLGRPIEVVEGSVADADAVARACDGVGGIVHLAALPSVARSVETPLDTHDVNVTGTVVVLDAARQRRLRVVYAGSSSAYGDQDAEYKVETMRESPLSPYAASKLAGELYCRAFARVYGIDVVVTRFFNVFGPRQVPDSPYSGVVAAFCHALLNGSRPRIDGDGGQSRDFTYVGDVVRGIGLALTADLRGCHVVNLACGGSHTVRELLDTLSGIAGTAAEPVLAPPRTGDVRHSKADIARARELLGFAPSVSFAEGLQITYDWYRSIRS